MLGTHLRFGDSLRHACAIGALPEDAFVAFAVRLVKDPFAVSGPQGVQIASSKCQPSNGGLAVKIVDPDVGFFAVIGSYRNLLRVWRKPDRHIIVGQKCSWGQGAAWTD